ncbi:MAG: hypothetical protein NTV58_04460 [Deltaproteobacteria bacterium]|nr:hypothetical protein [Deltaproteobacteria bacterium]
MAKRNQNTFFKRQKEIKRRQDAQEKMARRQGKKKQDEQEGEEMQLVAPADAEPVGPTTEPAGPAE